MNEFEKVDLKKEKDVTHVEVETAKIELVKIKKRKRELKQDDEDKENKKICKYFERLNKWQEEVLSLDRDFKNKTDKQKRKLTKTKQLKKQTSKKKLYLNSDPLTIDIKQNDKPIENNKNEKIEMKNEVKNENQEKEVAVLVEPRIFSRERTMEEKKEIYHKITKLLNQENHNKNDKNEKDEKNDKKDRNEKNEKNEKDKEKEKVEEIDMVQLSLLPLKTPRAFRLPILPVPIDVFSLDGQYSLSCLTLDSSRCIEYCRFALCPPNEETKLLGLEGMKDLSNAYIYPSLSAANMRACGKANNVWKFFYVVVCFKNQCYRVLLEEFRASNLFYPRLGFPFTLTELTQMEQMSSTMTQSTAFEISLSFLNSINHIGVHRSLDLFPKPIDFILPFLPNKINAVLFPLFNSFQVKFQNQDQHKFENQDQFQNQENQDQFQKQKKEKEKQEKENKLLNLVNSITPLQHPTFMVYAF